MLTELTIKDFAIIEDLTLTFASGFNVLTGETGAGKSIILDAVSLLLGGRASNDDIRTGAQRAEVEGCFTLGDGPTRQAVEAVIARESLEGDSPDELLLTREVRRGGRNAARVNGHVVNLSVLEEIGEALVDIHGQSDHLSLLKPTFHLELLDRYGGLTAQRSAFAELVREIEKTRAELKDLVENADATQRRVELLTYQVQELEAASLKPGEDEELKQEARRLANAEQLAELIREAYQGFHGALEGRSASDLVAEAAGALARLVKIDPEAADIAELAETISIQVEELTRLLADYEESVEFDPVRLQDAELRLDLIRNLKRKYLCDSIEDLLKSAEDAQAELGKLENSEERIEALRAEELTLLQKIGAAGAKLSEARSKAAARLSQRVEAELRDLRMADARFAVSVEQVDDAQGAPVGDYRVAFDRTGIDRVAYLIAPNVGEPLKPIARIASGGETSRIMLALKTVLSRADETPTLIFDEIDAGIGGRIGAVVGQKLWSLSDAHQVLVVTHLPQLAGFAETHFKVEKQLSGKRTVATVQTLDREDRVGELAEMLGAEASSARKSAEEILEYVGTIKSKLGHTAAPAAAPSAP